MFSNIFLGFFYRFSLGFLVFNYDVSYLFKFSLWFIINNIRVDLIFGEKYKNDNN